MAYTSVMNNASDGDPLKEESNGDKLKQIEGMLGEIGAPSPAAALSQQQQTAKAASKAISAQMQTKDCLAGDQRTNFTSPKMTKHAAQGGTPSLVRGAPLAGKDHAAEKRYLGKGLNVPPSDSPGPIYAAPSSFGTSAVMGAGANTGAGVSFARAGRREEKSTSCTPGPNSYSHSPTIGRQAISASKNAPSAVFGSAARDGERKNKLPPGPGPQAYHSNILRLPGASTPSPDAIGASMAGRQPGRQFISNAHVVDSVGAESPGPLTYNPAGMESNQGRFKSAPAFSFPHSTRDGGASVEPQVEPADAEAATTTSKARARALQAARKETPGPGQYDVKTKLQDKRAGSAFLAGRANEKIWVSPALSAVRGKDSPGLCYTPTYDMQEKHVKGAHLGQGPDVDQYRDRFDGHAYIGKGFGNNQGAASPGPVYEQGIKLGGPSFTMVHKERSFPKKVFPGPDRVRWISQETAKDNMGAFSPGPKYDTRGDIAKGGPSHSFGVSDREFGEHFSAAQKAQFGTAQKPYTCPAEARFVSLAHQKAGMAGKCSPGPCQYNAAEASLEVNSQRKKAVSVGIYKPVETKVLHPPPGKHDGEPPRLVEPHYDLVQKQQPTVSFTQAERWGGGNAVEKHQSAKKKKGAEADDAASKKRKKDADETTPGPGAYAVKTGLTEKNVHGGSFGGLP